MTTIELQKFIKECIDEQGNQSAIWLFKLVKELSYHIPHIVHLTGNKVDSEDKGRTIYEVATPQDEIDSIIDAILVSEEADICVFHEGLTLHFDYIETFEDFILGYLVSTGNSYELMLSKEKGQSSLSVMKGESGGGGDGQKHWFGTSDEYSELESKDDNTIYIITKK